jgi:hypothetical protein
VATRSHELEVQRRDRIVGQLEQRLAEVDAKLKQAEKELYIRVVRVSGRLRQQSVATYEMTLEHLDLLSQQRLEQRLAEVDAKLKQAEKELAATKEKARVDSSQTVRVESVAQRRVLDARRREVLGDLAWRREGVVVLRLESSKLRRRRSSWRSSSARRRTGKSSLRYGTDGRWPRSRSVAFSMRVVARFLVILRGDEKASLSSALIKAEQAESLKQQVAAQAVKLEILKREKADW